MSSRPSRSPNLNTTKNFIKRISPFVITGAAAIAEHHFLRHDDKSQDKKAEERPREKDDDSSIRRLKREVRGLKKSLKRKGKRVKHDIEEAIIDSSSSSSSSSSDDVSIEVVVGSERERGQRRRGMRENGEPYGRQDAHNDELPLPRGFEQREIPEIRVFPPPPRAPTPPPAPFGMPRYIPVYQPPTMEDTASVPRRHRRRRRTSLPPPLLKDEAALHATKAATIAGIIEGVHVAESKGSWFGPKGARVGTAMATAAGTSFVRARRGDDATPADMVVDVGAGLLVTRLAFGSTRKLEDKCARGNGEEKRRRWSHIF